jgi:hypothetical protein
VPSREQTDSRCMQDSGRTSSELRSDIVTLIKQLDSVSSTPGPPAIYSGAEIGAVAAGGNAAGWMSRQKMEGVLSGLMEQMEGAGISDEVLSTSRMQAEQLQKQEATVCVCDPRVRKANCKRSTARWAGRRFCGCLYGLARAQAQAGCSP